MHPTNKQYKPRETRNAAAEFIYLSVESTIRECFDFDKELSVTAKLLDISAGLFVSINCFKDSANVAAENLLVI